MDEIPAGVYTFKSRCPTEGWGYICTHGYSITFGSTSFACKGDEVNTWYTQGVSNMSTAPASGTLTVPSGATITKIWCQGDNGRMPEGCTSSGYFPND